MDGFLKFGLDWFVFGLLNLTCLPMSVDPGLVDSRGLPCFAAWA